MRIKPMEYRIQLPLLEESDADRVPAGELDAFLAGASSLLALEGNLWINNPQTWPTYHVTSQSPLSHQTAMHRFSGYFGRETGLIGTGTAGAGASSCKTTPAVLTRLSAGSDSCVGYLWARTGPGARRPNLAIGGALFERLACSPESRPFWRLSFYWLHPWERRCGWLLAAWPYWRARFGAFEVGPWQTDDMRSHIQAVGYPGLQLPLEVD